MGNKIYPIGIQNFESLRLDGYFYIALIPQHYYKIFFLST